MHCRICSKDIKEPVFSLGYQPISNEYYDPNSKLEIHYPLDLYFCSDCSFLQIDEVVKATDIFCESYPYVSSCSSSWLKHCSDYVDYVIGRFNMSKDSFVMELASNDGYLLQYFKNKGFNVLGVEPSRGVAEMAIKKGIPTDIVFFDENYKTKDGRKPKLIIANNVIAHNPNVLSFVRGVKNVMDMDGVFTIEFPHLKNLIESKQFDTIYHEHYSYFSLYSIMELMKRCGLEVFDVQELPTHGGSLRVFVKHEENESHEVKHGSIYKVIDSERRADLYIEDTYRIFATEIFSLKSKTLNFLMNAKSWGQRVVAYGAPAKGNTFLNYCGIRNDLIEYTVDRSSFKVGKVLPGSRIPIKSVEELLKDDPDYVFILPWNIAKEVRSVVGEGKYSFITAIPEVTIS